MSHLLKAVRTRPSSSHFRCLATVSSTSSVTATKTKLAKALEDGPAFEDFLSDNVPAGRVVLGNTKGFVPHQYVYSRHKLKLKLLAPDCRRT